MELDGTVETVQLLKIHQERITAKLCCNLAAAVKYVYQPEHEVSHLLKVV